MKRWIEFLKVCHVEVSEEQYQALDKNYILKERKEISELPV